MRTPPRALLLGVICLAPCMIVLDSNVVTVALPSIRRDLRFSHEDVQWVISAYVLAFGGFLIVGGRAADLRGRRRTLMCGLLLFTCGSLASGLAVSPTMLVVARAFQGIGAAIAFPASLSLLTTTFEEGVERNRALGTYGTLLSVALISAVALGGLLTELFGWRAVLFVNVPLGALGLVLVPIQISETRRRAETFAADIPRAVTATGALVVLLYGLTEAGRGPWPSLQTSVLLLLALALAGLALVLDQLSSAPLITRQLLCRRTVAGAGIAAVLTVGTGVGVLVVLSLYLQEILGYGPLESGLALTVLGVAGVLAGAVSPRLANRFGLVNILVGALIVQALGVLLMVPIDTTDGLVLVLIGTTIMGFGHFAATVTFTALGTSGIAAADHGVTVSVINSAQQIGGGLGLTLLVAVASARSDAVAGDGPRLAVAVEGYQWALATGAILSLLAAGMVMAVLRLPQPRRRTV